MTQLTKLFSSNKKNLLYSQNIAFVLEKINYS
jgi:hypothetical protein